MSLAEDEALRIARANVLRWAYLAESDADIDALCHLTDSVEAQNSWKDLVKKFDLDEPHLRIIASHIGRLTVSCLIDDSELRTEKEIEADSDQAIILSSRLINLIRRNAALRPTGSELIPKKEHASRERLLNGLVSQMTHNLSSNPEHNPEHFFTDDIEQELDELQEVCNPPLKLVHAKLEVSGKLCCQGGRDAQEQV